MWIGKHHHIQNKTMFKNNKQLKSYFSRFKNFSGVQVDNVSECSSVNATLIKSHNILC